MKTAKELKAIAKDKHKGSLLLAEITQMMEIHANEGQYFTAYLVEKKYDLIDTDYAISELVTAGFSVEEKECSDLYLTNIVISWS